MSDYNGFSANERNLKSPQQRQLRAMALPDACQGCGSRDRQRLLWHSESYDRAEAFCLCSTCHSQVHQRLRFPGNWRRYVQRAVEVFPGSILPEIEAGVHNSRSAAFDPARFRGYRP